MTTISEDALEVEVRIAARPSTVFSLLDNADGMAKWFGSSVQMDAKPGGTLRVDINGRDIAKGEIVEIVPPERIVFTFGWEGEGHPVPPGASRVEITLVEDGDGTIVRLRHSGLTAEQAASHKEGWDHFLPRLLEVAEGRDPGKDPWAE
ncbi:MAG: SRPBCC domain-containing protein [Chloroflexi bacterium]|nr:SRPBCC domain-containing protein [Chloroflexota bacterium]